ncbi:hypothetical protein ANCCEY_13994 [Ancylostoma ceylanicum]|uniref:Aminotransferase class V domain-containing protein n=1 Tax=Ancylostoma ceylanicum TaxID=53326 RepID=A0A0D6L6A7_9BILA|nr:hypothetical protein ANCCEY_13994 [Ancylostoma ceylanicum]
MEQANREKPNFNGQAYPAMSVRHLYSSTIAGGLGPTVGKLWRIGTFGGNSDKQKIEKVVKLLAETIKKKSNI